MGMETVEKQIDGRKFFITPFSATKSLALHAALINATGGALGKLVNAIPNGSILDADINGDAISDALEIVADRISEDRYVKLIKRLISGCAVENPKGGTLDLSSDAVFDLQFGGSDIVTVYKLIAAVFEVNFARPLAD